MAELEQTLESREVAEMIEKDQINIDVVKKVLDFLTFIKYTLLSDIQKVR